MDLSVDAAQDSKFKVQKFCVALMFSFLFYADEYLKERLARLFVCRVIAIIKKCTNPIFCALIVHQIVKNV